MRTPPDPSDLTDEQWSLLAPLLPPTCKKGRPRQTDMREMVNAICYINRAGCPWRMLPRDLPPWRTVYNYFEGLTQSSAAMIQIRMIQLLVHRLHPSKPGS